MRNRKLLTVLSILIIGLFGFSVLYNVFFINYVEPTTVIVNEAGEASVPPFPPSIEHLLGTDRAGNDILLRLLGGFSITFSILIGVVIVQVFIGLLATYLLHFLMNKISKWILAFFLPFQVMPAFLIAMLMMGNLLFFQSELSSKQLILTQIAIVVCIGVPIVVTVFYNDIKDILQEDFILCAYTLGASDARIFFKHVLPVLKPRLLAFTVQQMTNTFLLIMYLGIFQIFIGGKSDSALDIDGTRFLPLFGEWGGMIGESRNEIITAPWIFFGPLIVAVLILIALHLVKREIGKKQT